LPACFVGSVFDERRRSICFVAAQLTKQNATSAQRVTVVLVVQTACRDHGRERCVGSGRLSAFEERDASDAADREHRATVLFDAA